MKQAQYCTVFSRRRQAQVMRIQRGTCGLPNFDDVVDVELDLGAIRKLQVGSGTRLAPFESEGLKVLR